MSSWYRTWMIIIIIINIFTMIGIFIIFIWIRFIIIFFITFSIILIMIFTSFMTKNISLSNCCFNNWMLSNFIIWSCNVIILIIRCYFFIIFIRCIINWITFWNTIVFIWFFINIFRGNSIIAITITVTTFIILFIMFFIIFFL